MAGIKMSGAQYKRFMDWSEWKTIQTGDSLSTRYWDDTLFEVNGEEFEDVDDTIVDDAVIKILAGVVYEDDNTEVCSAVDFARRFIKADTKTTICVTVDKDRVDELIQALRAFDGAKIQRI